MPTRPSNPTRYRRPLWRQCLVRRKAPATLSHHRHLHRQTPWRRPEAATRRHRRSTHPGMDTGATRPRIKSGAGSDLVRTAEQDTPGTRYQPQLGDVVPPPETPGSDAKKKSIQAAERDTERVRQARHDYQSKISQVPFERLTFVDESGVNLSMTRRYGRAPRGQRVSDQRARRPRG